MFPRLYTFLYALSIHGWQITAAESLGANTVSVQKWFKLNETVGGKLYSALPVSASCFHVVNGKNVSVDAKACQIVQDGYTSPAFRAPKFGAYMLVGANVCFLRADTDFEGVQRVCSRSGRLAKPSHNNVCWMYQMSPTRTRGRTSHANRAPCLLTM